MDTLAAGAESSSSRAGGAGGGAAGSGAAVELGDASCQAVALLTGSIAASDPCRQCAAVEVGDTLCHALAVAPGPAPVISCVVCLFTYFKFQLGGMKRPNVGGAHFALGLGILKLHKWQMAAALLNFKSSGVGTLKRGPGVFSVPLAVHSLLEQSLSRVQI